MVMGDKSKLTKEEHRHYIEPFPTARDRTGPWTLAKELVGSSDWYARLWKRRERIAAPAGRDQSCRNADLGLGPSVGGVRDD